MKDNELLFDRKSHVLYSKPCKKEILAKIALHYPEAERETVWEKVQLQYAVFLSDWRIDLGGKKNFLKFVDCNKPFWRKLMYKAFVRAKSGCDKWHDYEMDVAPYENSKPIYYEFTACPAADATIPSAAIRIHT